MTDFLNINAHKFYELYKRHEKAGNVQNVRIGTRLKTVYVDLRHTTKIYTGPDAAKLMRRIMRKRPER